MSDEQQMVTAFHRAFDIVIGTSPAIPDEATCALRVSLIQEEFDELREALAQRDVEAVAKELADLLYVVYGTAVSCGMDMAPVFREVHRSNMSKVGGHKRADGKWLKPPDYSPARLQPILAAQGALGYQSVATHAPGRSDGPSLVAGRGGGMRIDDVVGNVRGCIRAMQGYVPGKQPTGGVYIKLNTNENPYPPSPRVLEALREAVGADLRLYPDPVALRLRETAAELYGCEVDEVIAGNGSDDILTMVFRTFLDAGDVIATPAPSYTLYNALSALQNATCKEIPMGPGYTLPEDLDAHRAKVVIIVNPNAPTGVLHPRAALRAFLERTQSMVMIDEAYADFAGESAIDMLKEFPHLIVVRTFSKAYALAGVRLGLGFARREIIAEMMKVKDSYNLDRLAVIAGCAALQDQAWLRETVGMIIRTRTWMQQALEALGLQVPLSRSNFVFPAIPEGRAAAVFEALEQRRILVRYFRGPLVKDALRVSVGTDAEVEAFVRALQELLTEG